MGPELLPVTRTLPTFTGKLAYNTAAALWHVMDDRDRSWELTGRLGTFVNDPATGGKPEGSDRVILQVSPTRTVMVHVSTRTLGMQRLPAESAWGC